MAKALQIVVGGVLTAAVAFGVYDWLKSQPFSSAADPSAPLPEAVEPGLILRNATLEQPDNNGVIQWRVRGEEVTYSNDQAVALITRPNGDLFQDGKAIYTIAGDRGEIRDNGTIIFVRGNVVATGLENDLILRGDELEWHPNEDLLVVRNNLTGSHPQMRATATEAHVYNRQKLINFLGNVVANTVVKDPKVDPWLKLQGQHLVWFWETERLESPQPVRMEQFKANAITDVIVGQRGFVTLNDQVATIHGSVVAQLLQIPINVSSEVVEWRVAEQKVNVPYALTVVHPTEKLVVTARQGTFALAEEVITLNQDVVAVGERNQSRLTADRLTWVVKDQTMVAEGRVNYQQISPTINLNGNRGVGYLDKGTFVVDGGRVVTEITPN